VEHVFATQDSKLSARPAVYINNNNKYNVPGNVSLVPVLWVRVQVVQIKPALEVYALVLVVSMK